MTGPEPLPAASGGLPVGRRWAAAALLVVALAALVGALEPHRASLSYATPVLLVLVVVVAVALVGGLPVAVPAAVLGGVVLNVVFTPPYGSLAVERTDQLLALLVYLGCAVAVSVIVDQAARTTAQATRARAEARALSTLAGRTLAESRTLPDLLEQVRTTFGLRTVVLLDAAGAQQAGAGGGHEPSDEEWSVPAGPHARLVARGAALFAEDRRVLSSFAEAAGAALQERALRRAADDAARLQAADRMRTALLAAVGHDLRTPLAAVKASVSSLRASDVVFTDEERAELLATVEEGADRLQALVANLLDASRLQAGAVSVTLQPVALEEVCGRVLLALPAAERARVAVDVGDRLVLADPGLLERVVANLVDNALRHDSGTVRLHGADGLLDVVDHGPGLAPEQRELVFAPFQRLGDRSPGGVGLGLAVARGFAEAMGGAVEPRTTPGGGLTVRVRLAAAAGAAA